MCLDGQGVLLHQSHLASGMALLGRGDSAVHSGSAVPTPRPGSPIQSSPIHSQNELKDPVSPSDTWDLGG